MDFIQIGFLGFFLSAVMVFLAVKMFPFMGLLDFPERYDLKREKIPYPGGVVLLILCLGIGIIDARFLPVMLGLATIGVVSFFDDRVQLSYVFRLFVQFLVAIFIFFVGIRINFIGNPFAETNIELWLLFPWISFLLTVFWIVVIQNALNWFDGIPGLSVGISGVGFLVLGLLGLVRPELFFDSNHTTLTLSNLYLSGLCFGGFYFFWKRKIILGDTGSQVLGFLLAVMAIFSGAKIATTLLVLILPLLDFVLVIFRRVFIEKVSPFKGDLRHIHHNLANKVGESYASIILILVSLLFGVIAISLAGMVKMFSLLVVMIFVLLFILGLSK